MGSKRNERIRLGGKDKSASARESMLASADKDKASSTKGGRARRKKERERDREGRGDAEARVGGRGGLAQGRTTDAGYGSVLASVDSLSSVPAPVRGRRRRRLVAVFGLIPSSSFAAK